MSLYLGNNLIAPNQSNAANKSLSNLDATGQAVIDNKADVDLSNMSASQSAKNTIVDWIIPDWTSAESKIWNTTYTADRAGIVWFGGWTNSSRVTQITVNGVNYVNNFNSGSNASGSITPFLIGKGDTWIVSGYGTSTVLNFVPLKYATV